VTIVAKHHRALADGIEVQINALGLVIQALKRQRDAHRELEKFFSPPETPFPAIVPPPAGPDPDFDDPPPGDPSTAPEAAP
jgi:hypothetical protein